MNGKEFLNALEMVSQEKKIDRKYILEAMELALSSAYKKNFDQATNVRVAINDETGDIRVFAQYEIVENDDMIEDPQSQITLAQAHEVNADYKVGDILEEEVTPKDFGRVAAQTAKQVIMQKLREAERESIAHEYVDKEGELFTGVIDHEDNMNYYVNLGRANAILPKTEVINDEQLTTGSHVKIYLLKVEVTSKGVTLLVSRTHYGFVRRLFESEVPEIYDGTVEMKAVARDAGNRTKVAVVSNKDGVDPVGTCIGPKGERINNIIKELQGEKIDIVEWSSDPIAFIRNALKPAEVESVEIIDEKEKQALVIVTDEQLSLAIGKKGQNARLATKLTTYRIDIKTRKDLEAIKE